MATLILLRRSADWEPLFCGESKIHGGCLFESCVSFKNRTFEGTNFHPRIHDPCASKPRNFSLSIQEIYTRIYSGKNLTRKVNSILKNLISIHAYIEYICFSKKSNFQIFITSSYISYKRFHLENILRIYRNENNINIFTNILCTEN